jgi:hypothetical protein
VIPRRRGQASARKARCVRLLPAHRVLVRSGRGTVTGQTAASVSTSEREAGPSFAFDARRWTRLEVTTTGLSLVLVAFLTRPWYDIRVVTCVPLPGAPCQVDAVLGSASGTGLHDFLWLTALSLLLIVALLVVRAGLGRVPFLVWPDDRQLVAGAAVANFVIVLTAFLMKSVAVTVRGRFSSLPPGSGVSVTWESAAFVALIIAAAAAGAAVFNLPRAHRLRDAVVARLASAPAAALRVSRRRWT